MTLRQVNHDIKRLRQDIETINRQLSALELTRIALRKLLGEPCIDVPQEMLK